MNNNIFPFEEDWNEKIHKTIFKMFHQSKLAKFKIGNKSNTKISSTPISVYDSDYWMKKYKRVKRHLEDITKINKKKKKWMNDIYKKNL